MKNEIYTLIIAKLFGPAEAHKSVCIKALENRDKSVTFTYTVTWPSNDQTHQMTNMLCNNQFFTAQLDFLLTGAYIYILQYATVL